MLARKEVVQKRSDVRRCNSECRGVLVVEALLVGSFFHHGCANITNAVWGILYFPDLACLLYLVITSVGCLGRPQRLTGK